MISGQALEVSRHHDQRLEVSHFYQKLFGCGISKGGVQEFLLRTRY